MLSEQSDLIRATDRLAALRAEYHAPGTTAARRAQLEPLIARAKDWAGAAFQRHEDSYEAAHAAAPQNVRRVDGRGTLGVSTEAAGGSRAAYLRPGDDGHDAALAALQAREAQDALVAEFAYLEWGWRGPVGIDYYGDVAWVTDGSRRLRVQL